MSFLNSAALALLGLVPVILLLYFMKKRRTEVAVSCSFLWRRALDEARVDDFLQKLRANLLLLLQVLFIVLVTAALARPYVKSLAALPRGVVVVLDCSASMQARENGGTRFEQAKRKIRRLVEEARQGTCFVLVAASAQARMLTGFTPDRQSIVEALGRLEPEDTPTRLDAALALGASVVKSHPDARILLFTDGGGDFKEVEERYGDLVTVELLGKALRNLAVTAFDVQPSRTRGEFQVFVSVKSCSAARERALVSLVLGDIVKGAAEVSLEGRSEKSLIFDISARTGGRLEARLDARDALSLDDRAYAVLPSASADRSVLLVSSGNPFLEKALALLAPCTVKRVPVFGGEKADVTVWDAASVSRIPPGRHIFLNCALPKDLLPVGGAAPLSGTLTWDRGHPVNRFLDYSTLEVAEARKVAAPPWGKALLSAGGSDLLLLLDKGEHHSVALVFDPWRSNLFLSPLFPLLLNNAVETLAGERATQGRTQMRTGETIPLEGWERSVTLPSGREASLEKTAAPAFAGTSRVGWYRFSNGGRQSLYALNLLDAGESSLEPPAPAPRKRSRSGAAISTTALVKELWRAFALLALLLLLAEWAVYHRRCAR